MSWTPVEEEEERQCLAQECTNAARKGSKYCCRDCCLQLQTDRLNIIFPKVFNQWKEFPSVAELKDRQRLRELAAKLADQKVIVERLERERDELEEFIHHVLGLVLDKKDIQDPPEDKRQDNPDAQLSCISCGSMIQNRNFLKHLDRCYSKMESKRDLVASQPLRLPVTNKTPIFCDAYNKREGTYCKKFHTLCHKHYKGATKSFDYQICGFFLSSFLVADGKRDDICKVRRKKCLHHFGWEKIQRAQLDGQRFNAWLKYETLLVEQSRIQEIMKERTERTSVTGILLNRTTSHSETLPPELTFLLQEERKFEIQNQQENSNEEVINVEL